MLSGKLGKSRKKDPADHFTSKRFGPYAKAIGEAVLAWNNLHETLGVIFEDVCFGSHPHEAMAVWQSVTVDRSKRKMLEAALLAKSDVDVDPIQKENLIWVLARTEALEDARNQAVHAPLADYTEDLDDETKTGIHGFDLLGNRRAERLAAKNVLAEYRFLRTYLVRLEAFGEDVMVWRRGQPFPKRPISPAVER